MEDDQRFLHSIVSRLRESEECSEWDVGEIVTTEGMTGVRASRFGGDYAVTLTLGDRSVTRTSPTGEVEELFDGEDDAVSRMLSFVRESNARISERPRYHVVLHRTESYTRPLGLYEELDGAKQRLLDEVDEEEFEQVSDNSWATPDRTVGYYIDSAEVLG